MKSDESSTWSKTSDWLMSSETSLAISGEMTKGSEDAGNYYKVSVGIESSIKYEKSGSKNKGTSNTESQENKEHSFEQESHTIKIPVVAEPMTRVTATYVETQDTEAVDWTADVMVIFDNDVPVHKGGMSGTYDSSSNINSGISYKVQKMDDGETCEQ